MNKNLDTFLENIKDGPYIYVGLLSINLLDSNLDVDFDLVQMELVNEPDILPSISPDLVPNFSTNNLVFKTPDPIKNTRKITKCVVLSYLVYPCKVSQFSSKTIE